MKYLLDTHVAMWALADDKRLGSKAKDIILNPDNQIYYSTVSPWEVEIKHLKTPESFKLKGEQLIFLCNLAGYINLPILDKHIQKISEVEEENKNKKHNDPFDKMLLAQAKSEKMILITHDKRFKKYNEENLLMI